MIKNIEFQNNNDFKRVIHRNEAATLWDMGDDVACVEIHSKMNCFSPLVFEIIDQSIRSVEKQFRALVLGNNDSRSFSVGADLKYFISLIQKKKFSELEKYLTTGQNLFVALRYAHFPVVAAAHGLALGGGCEFMLHADQIIAHQDLRAGLPETLVGLVPAWGGCIRLLSAEQANNSNSKAAVFRIFNLLLSAEISKSAPHAKEISYLKAGSRIVEDRESLLNIAKQSAIRLSENSYSAPKLNNIPLVGKEFKSELLQPIIQQKDDGIASELDVYVASVLATILVGGEHSEPNIIINDTQMMKLEKNGILELVRLPKVVARIEHMLATGKALRN